MHFYCPRFKEHLHYFLRCSPADNGVVDDYYTLALHRLRYGRQLRLHALVANMLFGLDKGAVNVAVFCESEFKRYTRCSRKTERNRYSSFRDGNDHVGIE